jgi:hypothetical protein
MTATDAREPEQPEQPEYEETAETIGATPRAPGLSSPREPGGGPSFVEGGMIDRIVTVLRDGRFVVARLIARF